MGLPRRGFSKTAKGTLRFCGMDSEARRRLGLDCLTQVKACTSERAADKNDEGARRESY